MKLMDEDGQNSNNASETSNASLEEIRRRAVEALVPVIDSVEGGADKRFELLMNAVRASDNASLLEKTLATAEAIEDPSMKAEALVDVINETSYRLKAD